jgi:hypothetical protein
MPRWPAARMARHNIGMRVSPEDARQRLQKLDPDSDYLNKPGNIDNH